MILSYHEWIMASKKKNLTTIDERTRSQNSRYDPFHHLEPRQGRTVFGCLLGHFCSRHWRVAVRVFNAPEALSLTCRCRGGFDFYLKYEEYEFCYSCWPCWIQGYALLMFSSQRLLNLMLSLIFGIGIRRVCSNYMYMACGRVFELGYDVVWLLRYFNTSV